MIIEFWFGHGKSLENVYFCMKAWITFLSEKKIEIRLNLRAES